MKGVKQKYENWRTRADNHPKKNCAKDMD